MQHYGRRLPLAKCKPFSCFGGFEVTYYYFRRGQTVYWHEQKEFVVACHRKAFEAIGRGFPPPEKIEQSDLHPSRIGYAWRLNGPQDVG